MVYLQAFYKLVIIIYLNLLDHWYLLLLTKIFFAKVFHVTETSLIMLDLVDEVIQ